MFSNIKRFDELDWEPVQNKLPKRNRLDSDKVYARVEFVKTKTIKRSESVTLSFGEDVWSLLGLVPTDYIDILQSKKVASIFRIKRNLLRSGYRLSSNTNSSILRATFTLYDFFRQQVPSTPIDFELNNDGQSMIIDLSLLIKK